MTAHSLHTTVAATLRSRVGDELLARVYTWAFTHGQGHVRPRALWMITYGRWHTQEVGTLAESRGARGRSTTSETEQSVAGAQMGGAVLSCHDSGPSGHVSVLLRREQNQERHFE